MIEARVESRAELIRRGLAASGAGRHSEALEVWSGLRAKMPHHLPAVIGMASALLGLGREDEVARLAGSQSQPSSGVFPRPAGGKGRGLRRRRSRGGVRRAPAG